MAGTIEVCVRRPCSEQNVQKSDQGPSGWLHYCAECHARSYRKDGLMDHNPVSEWISLDEFRDHLKETR